MYFPRAAAMATQFGELKTPLGERTSRLIEQLEWLEPSRGAKSRLLGERLLPWEPAVTIQERKGHTQTHH